MKTEEPAHSLIHKREKESQQKIYDESLGNGLLDATVQGDKRKPKTNMSVHRLVSLDTSEQESNTATSQKITELGQIRVAFPFCFLSQTKGSNLLRLTPSVMSNPCVISCPRASHQRDWPESTTTRCRPGWCMVVPQIWQTKPMPGRKR